MWFEVLSENVPFRDVGHQKVQGLRLNKINILLVIHHLKLALLFVSM